MRFERLFHFSGAGLEDLKQVPVAAFEICEHLGQLTLSCFDVEPKNPVDNMIGPGPVSWIEVSGSVAGLKGLTTTRAGSGRR